MMGNILFFSSDGNTLNIVRRFFGRTEQTLICK